MKLLRYGPNGHVIPGMLDDNGHIRSRARKQRDDIN
jgi:hypothetical protein